MLRFEDLYVVSNERVIVTDAELAQLERALEATLPSGYRALVTTLGLGTISSVLEVKSPGAVLEGRAAFIAHRVLAPEHRFWKNWNDFFLPGDEAKLVSLATSLGGDEVCMHTDDPGVLVVLPRNRDSLFVADSFEEALFSFVSKRAWFEPRRAHVERTLEYDAKRVDDVLDLLGREMSADFDDGADPPGAFFFARPGAMVDARDAGKLCVRVDEAHRRFIGEVASCVADRLMRPPGELDAEG